MNTQQIIFFCLFELGSCPLQTKLLDNPVTLDKLNKLEQLQSSLKKNESLVVLSWLLKLPIVDFGEFMQKNSHAALWSWLVGLKLSPDNIKLYTVEPRYNKPLYNKDPGITNDIVYPSCSKMFGKEPRFNKPLL